MARAGNVETIDQGTASWLLAWSTYSLKEMSALLVTPSSSNANRLDCLSRCPPIFTDA